MVDNDLHPQQHRDVIVIGGSAGAGEALRRLLSALPAQTPAAILVVLHMSAHGHGIMRTVSAGANGITVVEAADGMRIEPHTLYVAVADRHLMVADGQIVLGTGPRENMSRPSIDALFRSAAVAFGPRTVGVLLSGMLNDGTAGLDAIHACGGTVLVQDPGEAVASDMPLSALQRVPADAVRSSAELGVLIAELAQTAAGPARVITDALRLEVAIARGALTTTDDTARIATPVAMSCPACGGVLSQISESCVLRFRCQVGHAYTGENLLSATEGSVDEALRIALRIIDERATLVARMADSNTRAQPNTAAMYRHRADEYRGYADTLRKALLRKSPLAAAVEPSE
ncbi:two-component system chemotaxis response regulator CheB [Xanthomonas arboricola]|uniref:chemotaxis protein CheB n=1 Tax=Xanthomonas campestris TaxID=339 RepID=UPI0023E9CC51|nr:two-component system chemotaxis response regulator CheB [Xanthomonas campestris]